jgi:hypothetical protein
MNPQVEWHRNEELEDKNWLLKKDNHIIRQFWFRNLPNMKVPSRDNIPNLQDYKIHQLQFYSKWKRIIRQEYLKIPPHYRDTISPPTFPFHEKELIPFIGAIKELKSMVFIQVLTWILLTTTTLPLLYLILSQVYYSLTTIELRSDFEEIGYTPVDLQFPFIDVDVDYYKKYLIQQQNAQKQHAFLQEQPFGKLLQDKKPPFDAVLMQNWNVFYTQLPSEKNLHRISYKGKDKKQHEIDIFPTLVPWIWFNEIMNYDHNSYQTSHSVPQTYVHNLSYENIIPFINALNERLGLPTCYDSTTLKMTNKNCSGWRLPFKEEWKYISNAEIKKGELMEIVYHPDDIKKQYVSVCGLSYKGNWTSKQDLSCTYAQTTMESASVGFRLLREHLDEIH